MTLKLAPKKSEIKSKTSLGFMGLLDISYFFILLETSHNMDSFTITTLIQGTLVVRVFIMKVFLYEKFRFAQYLGTVAIFVAILMNFMYFSNNSTYILLLGILSHSVNFIVKRSYIKKFRLDYIAMNNYILIFATGFGVILIPLLDLLVSGDIQENFVLELETLVGIKTWIVPVAVFFLLVSSVAHQFLLKLTINEKEGQKIIYFFNSLTTFLGFYLAELSLNYETSINMKIPICFIAITGSVIYHIYPEIPDKFNYSDY
jgi:hypothetical protein